MVAALATKGIDVTGVDLSPVQISGAREQWGHLPNAHFVHADVIAFLTRGERRWDAIYSIFGALYGAGFTGPQVWIYRWTYEPDVWAWMLTGQGFCEVNARVEPAPNPQNVGTLIVEARA